MGYGTSHDCIQQRPYPNQTSGVKTSYYVSSSCVFVIDRIEYSKSPVFPAFLGYLPGSVFYLFVRQLSRKPAS